MKTELLFLGTHINIATQARRRRLVMLIYAGLAALVIVWFSFMWRSPMSWLILFAYRFVARFLGGRFYEDGLVPPVDVGDERELYRRDHAYFQAYWWWDLSLIPALLSTGFRINPLPSAWDPGVVAVLRQLPFVLLIAAGILYYTLPQAILLWTEPDMEEAR
jgi:hypothetical protein